MQSIISHRPNRSRQILSTLSCSLRTPVFPRSGFEMHNKSLPLITQTSVWPSAWCFRRRRLVFALRFGCPTPIAFTRCTLSLNKQIFGARTCVTSSSKSCSASNLVSGFPSTRSWSFQFLSDATLTRAICLKIAICLSVQRSTFWVFRFS